jgi:hypothetical protein
VQPKYPIGTDPDAMERLIQDEIEARGYIPDPRRHRGQVQARDRGKIFNDALLKTVGHKDAPEGQGRAHDRRRRRAGDRGRNIQHTVRYTELAPDRFKGFWRD